MSSANNAFFIAIFAFAVVFSHANTASAAYADSDLPNIEVNLDVIDALGGSMDNGGWQKGPEGKSLKKSKAKKAKHETPAEPALVVKKEKAPKPEPKEKPEPKMAEPKAIEQQEDNVTIIPPEKPAPMKKAPILAPKVEAPVEKAPAPPAPPAPEPVPDAKKKVMNPAPEMSDITPPPPPPPAPEPMVEAPPPPPPAPMAKAPELSPADASEAKKALAPIAELDAINPPPPPPAALPDMPAPSKAVELTHLPPPPNPASEFAAALNEPASTKDDLPPLPEVKKPAPAEADGLPSLAALPGSKMDAPPPPALAAELPSPQALMDGIKAAPPAPAIEEPKPEVKTPEIKAPEPAKEEAAKEDTSGEKATLSITFLSTETSVPLAAKGDLDKLAKRLKDGNERVTLTAYASGANDQATTARRVSLSRALSVRAYLIDQGVNNLRINVQAEGNKATGGNTDRVDLLVAGK